MTEPTKPAAMPFLRVEEPKTYEEQALWRMIEQRRRAYEVSIRPLVDRLVEIERMRQPIHRVALDSLSQADREALGLSPPTLVATPAPAAAPPQTAPPAG